MGHKPYLRPLLLVDHGSLAVQQHGFHRRHRGVLTPVRLLGGSLIAHRHRVAAHKAKGTHCRGWGAAGPGSVEDCAWLVLLNAVDRPPGAIEGPAAPVLHLSARMHVRRCAMRSRGAKLGGKSGWLIEDFARPN